MKRERGGGGGSWFTFGGMVSAKLKIESIMNFWEEDLMVNIFKFTQGVFDIYLQSKDIADFQNL